MQISQNTTQMPADLSVWTDKDGRQFCVVVVKGSFQPTFSGSAELCSEQQPMTYSDIFFGDPEKASIQYESDFAPEKPRADLLINGVAHAPGGKPTTRMTVGVEAGSISKHLRITGMRFWEKNLVGMGKSRPVPFTTMPVVYEHAFGGSDHTHKKEKHHGTELRNPIGVGFRKNADVKMAENLGIPMVEYPNQPMKGITSRPEPAGFGSIGRGWQPRISHGGTYDAHWIDHVSPFLPQDFDPQYFQSAPEDQQLSSLKPGMAVRCVNLCESGLFQFVVPDVKVPIHFHYKDKPITMEPEPDTLLIEPHLNRFMLTWRAKTPLSRKNPLMEIFIGDKPATPKSGKLRFSSISEFIQWKKRKRGGRS